MKSTTGRILAPVAAAAASVLLLTACGGDEKPTRMKAEDPGPACRTEGTVEAQPAASLEAAVAPYQEAGSSMQITEKFGGTAEVQVKQGRGADASVLAVVTLVRTGEGWVATSVTRC